MIKVLTISNEYHSAAKLGFKTELYLSDGVEEYDNDLVIRWGNGCPHYNLKGKEQDFKNVINPRKSIAVNCNKSLALKKLSAVVKTPAIYMKEIPTKKTVVVRPICHSGGNEFEVKRGPFNLKCGRQYATQFIKTNTEYRVWFANGHVLCARRIKRNKKKTKYPCRSQWGYSFCKTPIGLAEQTMLAAQAIGLEFGAADVLAKEGEFYFLELNSAPTIDASKILQFFQEHLNQMIQRKCLTIPAMSVSCS